MGWLLMVGGVSLLVLGCIAFIAFVGFSVDKKETRLDLLIAGGLCFLFAVTMFLYAT